MSCNFLSSRMVRTSRLILASDLPFVFFFNDTTTTHNYTLSLHDALPILFLMSRKIILIKQELLLLVYELNRSGLLAENEKIRPILAQLEKLLLCDLSPSVHFDLIRKQAVVIP